MTNTQIEHLSRGYVLVESTTICDDETCSEDDNISSLKRLEHLSRGYVFVDSLADYRDLEREDNISSLKRLEHLSRGYVFVDSLADYRDLEREVQRVGHSITAGNDEKKRKEDAEKAAKNILRPLSDYEHNRVQHALYDRGPLEEKLATSTNDSVMRKSIRTLRPREWLNDEVINYYYFMLAKRDEALTAANPVRKRNHFFKSFFFTKLFDEEATKEYTYKNVKEWSNKVPGNDIFALDKVLFACNVLHTHWTCVVIFMQEKRIQFYDSMRGDGYHYSDGLLKYLKDEWAAKKGGELPDAEKWRVVGAETVVPWQNNGYDCGVFTCMYADFLSINLPLSFVQTHIDQCRHRIVLSILEGEVVIDGACELAGEADGALVASPSVTADDNDAQIISDGSEDVDFDNVSEDGDTENTSEDGDNENTSEVGDSDDVAYIRIDHEGAEYIGNDHEDANSDINIPDLDNDPYWERENNSSTLVHPNNSPSSEHTVDHDADQDDQLVCMLRETYDKCYDTVASSIFLSCPVPPEASEIFTNQEDFIKFFEDKFDLMIALLRAYYKGPKVNNLEELRACLRNRDDLFPLVCHGTAYRKRGCPLKDFIKTFDRHDFKFTHCRDSPYGCKIHPTPNLKMVNQAARRTVDAIKGVSGVKGVGGLIDSYDKEFRQTFRYWNDEFARKIQTMFSDPRQYIRAHFKESWDKQVSYIMFMLHLLQVNNEHHLQVRLFLMTGRWRTNKCYIESRIRFKIDLRIGQDGS